MKLETIHSFEKAYVDALNLRWLEAGTYRRNKFTI